MRHRLTDPANAEIARRYYRWLKEVRAELAAGVLVRTAPMGELHTPETFRAELWRMIDKRINLRGGGQPTGRKWESDYYWSAWRDSRRIQDRVLRRVIIRQLETAEARKRLGYLIDTDRE